MKNLTIYDFLEMTASDAPAPGGGSVSALCGALGAALASMVAQLTVSKDKSDELSAEMNTVIENTKSLIVKLSDDIKRDSDAFNQVMATFKMPKVTEDEKKVRSAAIQNGYKAAAEVPLDVAKTCLSVIKLSEVLNEKGNSNAKTDSLVSAMCARSGGLGALYNAWINLGTIKDTVYVEEMKNEIYCIGKELIALEEKILSNYTLVF